MGVTKESERDGAELRSNGEPSDRAVGEEEVAAGTSSGSRFEAGIVDGKARRGTEPNRKVGKERVEWIGRSERWTGGRRRARGSARSNESMGDGGGRGARDTFQRIIRVKDSGVVGSRSSSTVGEIELESDCQMLGDERMIEASKAVNIPHHASRPMKDLEEVTKEFLGPTTDLMDGSVVFENFFDGAAIAKPKELRTPQKFAILADSPATAGGLADERMEMTFALGATARAKANGSQTGAVHGEVKSTDTVGTEKSKSDLGSIGMVWLHKDPTHAGTGPIRLQKTRERGVIASKARGRGNGKLQFIPEASERRRPHSRRNGLAMMLAFESAKRLDTDLEEGAIYIVEGEEADEGTQGLAVDGERPIVDEIELGFGRTIAVRGDIVTDILNSVSEEFTLLQLESDSIFHEDIADAFKQLEQGSEQSSPEQDIVDDDATAEVRGTSGVTRAVEGLPFITKDLHHAGIKRRCVARAKRHHRPTPFLVVRREER
jgi:hypothetical protein